MQNLAELWDRLDRFLRTGIAGSEFTPLRLFIVITLTTALVWITRRLTRWLVDGVLARRGVDVGLREALGAIARYLIITLGALVILAKWLCCWCAFTYCWGRGSPWRRTGP